MGADLRSAVATARKRGRTAKAETSRRKSEAMKRYWAERKAEEAERDRRNQERALKAARTRAVNRARAEAERQRRSEVAKRSWVERKTLSPKKLEQLRETRKEDKKRERYEQTERRAIQREELGRIKKLGKLEQQRLMKTSEKLLTATDKTRPRLRAVGHLHFDRIEAIGFRRDLVRRGIPESVILKVKITDSFAVQQLAASLGVTPHSIYTMRLSPKATGGHASKASAKQAMRELAGVK